MQPIAEMDTREMTMEHIVDLMIEIQSNEELAKEFLDKCVADALENPANSNCSQGMMEQRVRRNLGYMMGYAPTRIDTDMWKRIGCAHPMVVV